MKNLPFILIVCLLSFNIQAQTLQTKSVTISPTAGNVEEVKGNIRATGTIESNTLKAAGLATGDPFKANPVYANVDGTLVTGYKVGYFSIPPVAFRLSTDVQTDGQTYGIGTDYVVYDGSYLGLFLESSGRTLLAPVYVPHKSKLSSIKFTFASNDASNSRAMTVNIIKASIDNFSNGVSIFSFTTPSSLNSTLVTVELPIDLIEIDNQNYVYTLQLISSTNDWSLTSVRGAVIEYRDL